jgi:hypothetical protein
MVAKGLRPFSAEPISTKLIYGEERLLRKKQWIHREE